MGFFKLFKTGVTDPLVQENFTKLDEYLQNEPFRKGQFKFMELDLTLATPAGGYPATLDIPHGLGFIPKDIVVTAVVPGTATVVWNWNDFTRTYLNATISAAVVIRAYVGRYGER